MNPKAPGYKYEFGANGATTPDIEDEKQIWSIILFPSVKDNLPLNVEARITAQKIANEAKALGQPIRLHLSGGDDSKAMINAFIWSGIPFRMTTRVHKMQGKVINQADVDAALAFCKYINRETDLHVIDDLDLRWGDTEHRYFLDMTALSARLGWERYKDEYNLLATTPYLMTGGDKDWELLPTFSMSPNYLHSFFLHNPGIFRAQLAHPIIEQSRPARDVLKHVANSMKGAERWAHLADVFAYEQIVKPMLMRNSFPWLEQEGRPKATGFDEAPFDMNIKQPSYNERYHELLKKKVFRVPVARILSLMSGDFPIRVWKEDDKIYHEALPHDYL
jgi:hypothetical protein